MNRSRNYRSVRAFLEIKSELARLRKQLQDHDEYVDGPPN